MTPEELARMVADALAALADDGEVRMSGAQPPIRIERPKVREHGDYSSNVALQLAKQVGRPPRELAELLARRLRATPGIGSVDVAGPGFLNVRVEASAQGAVAGAVLAAADAYGTSDDLAGQRINLEFVSANPTGPIHLGGVRWAAVGDSLARILAASGAEVSREYYFNDHGGQIDRFARSLLARARGRDVPDDGYAGAYIDDIAADIVNRVPDVLDRADDDAQEVFRREGTELSFEQIKRSLHDFGVDFDTYFHENTLHESGAVQRAIDRLTALGRMYEAEGALWLRTTDFGDDKDRVVVRSTGQPAYISSDLAYYLDKRERGFDRVFILLGADHHGYVARMMAMCAAFGDIPGENLEVYIGQMVNLVRGGEPVRMSKRAGTTVSMDDLVEAIGVDASRYAMVRYSADSTIDIDVELWSRRTSDNPVFYVQYAHARLASILRNADDLGIPVGPAGSYDPSALGHEREGELLRALADLPRVVQQAAVLREPHRVARYLEDTAATFHKFYDDCRVLPLGDEEVGDAHRARLALVAATRVVLANGLRLLGVSAPERM